MGVDYSARFGIGYELENNSGKEYYEFFEDLESLPFDGEYEIFSIGNGCYTGEANRIFIIIKNPFSNGFAGIEEKLLNLENFLKNNNLKTIGDFGLHGGIYVS